MKKLFIFCILIFVLTVGRYGNTAEIQGEGKKPTGATSDHWSLVFEDTFDDSSTLNPDKWIPYYRPGRNEYKASHGNGNGSTPLANYVIEDGILKIRIDEKIPVRKTPLSPTVVSIQTSRFHWNKKQDNFTVEDKFATKYGWFEIRSRMPAGSGLHSAFWLLQKEADQQEFTLDGKRRKLGDGVVEIDIFEMLGNMIDEKINYFNVHFTKNGHHKYKFDFDCSKEFHIWGLNWEEGKLTWYLDGKEIYVYTGETPQREMYILLGLYMGSGWTGKVDPQMVFPRDFEIDYIRVWKNKQKNK